MFNLDTTLRSPGRVLLLERDHAQALIDRSLESRRNGSGGNSLLSRAMSAMARIGRPRAATDEDDEEVDRSKLAMPSISWAGTIEWGDGYAIVDGIAVIDIAGVLTPDGYYDWWEDCWYGGYSQIASAVVAARSDDRVNALFIRVNSPGGLVDGCFDLADLIAEGNGKAGGKPVWVHARMACSAAYALASAADHIVASAEADVGSIGVLIVHVDVSAFYAEHGIKVEAIESGPRKTDGAEWKPLSDDARAHLKGVVDQVARRFTSVVSAGRDMKPEAIVALQARWFLAQHDDPTQSGEQLGLVDAISPERVAFAALLNSLSDETGSGAPGGEGSTARAVTGKEVEMSLKDQVTALRAKAAKGDKTAIAELKALGIALEAETDETGVEAETETEEETAAEEPATEEDEEDEAEEEPAAGATGTAVGFSLLNAPEASGRDALAKQLAAKVASKKLTYGEAKKMLASAPKGSRLANSMAGRDRNPGRDGGDGAKAGTGLGAAVDRLNAKATAGKR